MELEYYDYINGGTFINSYWGLNGKFFGEENEKITLSPNGLISYPIISLSRVYIEKVAFYLQDRYYYKLTVFVDRPMVYYKIKDEW